MTPADRWRKYLAQSPPLTPQGRLKLLAKMRAAAAKLKLRPPLKK